MHRRNIHGHAETGRQGKRSAQDARSFIDPALPNAWDAGSARLFARRGFTAIATTSAGVAWSFGEQAPLAEVLAAIARISRVVDLPVTADIETGYGETPADMAATVQAVDHAAGVLLESGRFDCQASAFTYADAQRLFESG